MSVRSLFLQTDAPTDLSVRPTDKDRTQERGTATSFLSQKRRPLFSEHIHRTDSVPLAAFPAADTIAMTTRDRTPLLVPVVLASMAVLAAAVGVQYKWRQRQRVDEAFTWCMTQMPQRNYYGYCVAED